ncbi:hypothetical protein [Pandoraea sp. CB10b_02]|uniref:hypothetical protein n=1 Tax=Pandoraea sp. CB10b_02 TaxID=2014535 RepID=UPI002579BBE7|nr:hypothetical protein [Pandoraea sp. CB10b_02]
MRDDAQRPAYCQTTPVTARRRSRTIAASLFCAFPVSPGRRARRAAAALGAFALFGVGAVAGTPAHAAGNYCQHAAFGNTSAERMTVCVHRQAFDNDVYVLRLDGKTALRGTDEEVAHGVFGRVGNRLVAMRCEAEAAPARVSPAVAQALSWQTGVRVQRITDALGSVETGRRCSVKIDGADAGMLTFAFD